MSGSEGGHDRTGHQLGHSKRRWAWLGGALLLGFVVAFFIYRATISSGPATEFSHGNQAGIPVGPAGEAMRGTNPQDADRLARASLAAEQEERWTDAIGLLKRAIAVGPYHEGRRYRLGQLMLQHLDPNEVIAYYEQTVDADPKPQTSQFMWGNALATQGRYDEAFRHYSAALAIDPAHEMSENSWGLALEQQGRLAEALTHFERALEIHPEFVQAHLNCARVLRQLGRPQDADTHLELARTSDPQTEKRYLYWGRALLKAGRHEAAAIELEKAVQVDPEDEESKRLLAEARRDQGS